MSLWEKSFTPMLLGETTKPFNSKDYIYEVKYDGIRALIYANKKGVKVFSRNMQDITSNYPELQNIKNIVNENVIFDGEIVCFDEYGYPSFSKLQARSHLKNKKRIIDSSVNSPVVFMCFDILYKNKDLINMPLIRRKEILSKYKKSNVFKKVFYIDDGKILYNETKRLNIEGIVAKEKESTYLINERSDSWLKIKHWKKDVFYICGYIDIKDNHIFTLILGELVNDELYYVGKVIVSKKNKLYEIIKNMKKISNRLKNYNGINSIFVQSKLKCSIEYLERTKSNSLRHPRFLNIE